LIAHFCAILTLSDLSIAAIILKPETTSIIIAAKKARTLKKDKI
jgi:hypothetical protein